MAAAITVAVMAIAATVAAVHSMARGHVVYMSGTEAAPMNCLPCHAYLEPGGVLSRLSDEDYLSPLDLAVSPDGQRLYVTAEEGGVLLVVDPTERRVREAIQIGTQPHKVILAGNGKTAYVSDRLSDNVAVVDLVTASKVRTLAVGSAPAGLALSPDESYLYVANTVSNDISIVDLESGTEIRRLVAGQNPYGVGVSPDGGQVYVTNRLSNPVPHRTPPVSEITVVDVTKQRVVQREQLRSAHVVEGIDFTPSGDLALVTLTRPKNLLPATQVGRGWMITFGIGVLDRDGNRVVQLLLDDVNAFYADPYDVLITPDGQRAFVTHSGADVVSVLDLVELRSLLATVPADSLASYSNNLGVSGRYVTKRIRTGSNPKGLALSPDGRRLYVAERFEDRVSIIDTDRLELVGSIDLGGPRKANRIRRGQRLFHNAGNTFQGQFSCRTCHPEGHHDALTYDLEPDGLGLNIVNNLSLRQLASTAPYKWTGKNASLYRQCGFRFAKWLTRTEPYSVDDLYSLVAYILSLSHTPNRFRDESGSLTAAQLRGRTIFERDRTNDGRTIPPEGRCITCHPPPRFTNFQTADVGTKGPTDTDGVFDTPHLDNLYDQGPYLHDGRAATLEQIWTRFNNNDEHGVANDLTKAQLNDLMEYLKTLGGSSHGTQRSAQSYENTIQD
jgi:YVTN family beta-propeller protein